MPGGTGPRETRPSQPPSIGSTPSAVGVTPGRPSAQPRSNIPTTPSVPAGAATARHPDGDLERVLEHGGGGEPGPLPGPAQWAEPAQGHRGGGALLRDEQQQRAAARGQAGNGHLGRAEPADRQSRRAPPRADP